QRFVGREAQRKVAFQKLVGHGGERRPERVPVRPAPERSARNAAEADLIKLEPLAPAVVARVHEMRAVGKAGGAHEVGTALPEQTAENVEDAAEGVRAAGERGGVERLEQRSGRN